MQAMSRRGKIEPEPLLFNSPIHQCAGIPHPSAIVPGDSPHESGINDIKSSIKAGVIGSCIRMANLRITPSGLA
jgi:hypothetical protein